MQTRREQMQSAMRSSMTSTRIPTTMSATPAPHLRCHPCRLGRLREQRRRQDARRICVRRCHQVSSMCRRSIPRRTRRANSRVASSVSSCSVQSCRQGRRGTASASRSPRTAWTGMSPNGTAKGRYPRHRHEDRSRQGQGRPRVAERQLDPIPSSRTASSTPAIWTCGCTYDGEHQVRSISNSAPAGVRTVEGQADGDTGKTFRLLPHLYRHQGIRR